MDHENQELSPTVSQSGEPQEVVLRYEAPVTPIVERYVQPTPLPGQPKKHTSPRKKRKGLKIFLFCMLGLLLVSGVSRRCGSAARSTITVPITTMILSSAMTRIITTTASMAKRPSSACPTPIRSSSATMRATARR